MVWSCGFTCLVVKEAEMKADGRSPPSFPEFQSWNAICNYTQPLISHSGSLGPVSIGRVSCTNSQKMDVNGFWKHFRVFLSLMHQNHSFLCSSQMMLNRFDGLVFPTPESIDVECESQTVSCLFGSLSCQSAGRVDKERP